MLPGSWAISVENFHCASVRQFKLVHGLLRIGARLIPSEAFEANQSRLLTHHCRSFHPISLPSGGRRFKHRLCEKVFKHKNSLKKRDVDAHDNGKTEISKSTRYKCKICGDSFPTKRSMYYHRQRHQEKPLQCPKCDQTFYSKWFLERHLLVHSDEKPFRCALCERTFKTASHLNVHLERHGKERNFKCTKCSAAFRSLANLHNHTKLHGKDNSKHSCKLCDAKFIRPAHLREHMQVHSNVRDFACGHCPYRAKTKERLTLHEMTHLPPEEKRQFACAECKKTYISKSGLYFHVRRNHTLSASSSRRGGSSSWREKKARVQMLNVECCWMLGIGRDGIYLCIRMFPPLRMLIWIVSTV